MQALREVVKPANRDFHLTLPDWAIGQEVEVIILPFAQPLPFSKEVKPSLIDRLIADPMQIADFKPLDREQAHER